MIIITKEITVIIIIDQDHQILEVVLKLEGLVVQERIVTVFNVNVAYQQFCKLINIYQNILNPEIFHLRLTTNKPGVNQGRKFYKCNNNNTCKLFEWEDGL